jgi:hydrogenase maturation protease
VLTIIGCGNSNRSDDGVGVYIAQQLKEFLRETPRENVRVFDAGTGGMDVMFQARGSSRLIIIDAGNTGSEPGSIYQVPGEELTADREQSYSLHDFRWDNALYAGRRIFKDDFPTDVTVYLIEAAKLDLGLEMSEPVIKAADEVIEILRKAIGEYD